MTTETKLHRLTAADLVSDVLFQSAAFALWKYDVKQTYVVDGLSVADIQESAPLTDAECEDIIAAFEADSQGDGNDMPTGRRPETPLGYDFSRCESIADMRAVVMSDCLRHAVERMRPYAAWLGAEK